MVRLSVPDETSVVGDVAVAMSNYCKLGREVSVLVLVSVSVEEGVNEWRHVRNSRATIPERLRV